MDSIRADKYLWAIRAFKTRSEATDACNGGKVKLNGVNAKASKAVKIGDVLEVRKGIALYTYKILKLSENRMGASMVPDYAEDLTPESETAKLHAPRPPHQERAAGARSPAGQSGGLNHQASRSYFPKKRIRVILYFSNSSYK